MLTVVNESKIVPDDDHDDHRATGIGSHVTLDKYLINVEGRDSEVEGCTSFNNLIASRTITANSYDISSDSRGSIVLGLAYHATTTQIQRRTPHRRREIHRTEKEDQAKRGRAGRV